MVLRPTFRCLIHLEFISVCGPVPGMEVQPREQSPKRCHPVVWEQMVTALLLGTLHSTQNCPVSM